ncbi:uncharacterized protein LOC134840588 [Symsagittifera roscoffensis]|uniref:uncharacterized protein LOC134840588 n=1 Tax=Symsagittifera roscoffensis TaxID=84072 RepID=UPI00307CA5A4
MNSETISLNIVNVDEEVASVMNKFKRLRKIDSSATIVLSINNETNDVHLDQIDGESIIMDRSLEDIAEELVAEYLPKQMLRIPHVKTKDNRSSFPLCNIWYCPQNMANAELNMKYTSLRHKIIEMLNPQKLYQVSNHEELTDEWLAEEMDM